MTTSSANGSEGLEVHRAGPGDRAEQAALFNRCFKKEITPSDLAWRYDANPHGEAISLVYRPARGEAVCSFAYMPRKAICYGREETVGLIGQQGDVMTDPDWRRRGLVMKLSQDCARETAERGWPLNWGFPNRQSASVFRRVDWKSVGDIRPWDFYFRADRSARRERFSEGRLASLLLPLAVRLRCRPRRRALVRRALRAARSVRTLERFPLEVGELSYQVEQRFPFMVRRDAEYLNWRFIDTPSRRHRCLGLYDDEDELCGYAVVQPPGPDSIVGYVVDLLAPEDDDVAAVLEGALAELERSGAGLARATAVDGSWWQAILTGAGFLSPKPENHLYVYTFLQDEDHPLAGPSMRAADWYLTDGDRDDELMG